MSVRQPPAPVTPPLLPAAQRRTLNRALALATLLGVTEAPLHTAVGALGQAQAQTSTLKILVGFPPGGGSDLMARVLADKLKDLLGTPVVVENRAGAGGQIAAQALKAGPNDGSLVFLSHDHTISILPQVVKAPGFDPAQDFVAVAGFASFVNAFAVAGGTPARNFNEYLAWIRAQGSGRGTVGVPAPASVPEFLVKVVGQKYAIDLQSTAYRGSAPLIADLLGNQIGAGIASVPDFIENHKAGKLRIVAVLGNRRQALLPDVPTFAELGLAGFEDVPYYGLFAKATTPKAPLERISQAIERVLQMPDVREKLVANGVTVEYMTADQLSAREHAYTQSWSKIIRASGFQAQ